jgi:pectinesterase
MGATSNTATYTSNTVTISFSSSAAAAGSDDASGTLRVHKDNFALYNVNVKNTVSKPSAYSFTIFSSCRVCQFGQGSQALALSAYGTNHGYYASAFYGYVFTLCVFFVELLIQAW